MTGVCINFDLLSHIVKNTHVICFLSNISWPQRGHFLKLAPRWLRIINLLLYLHIFYQNPEKYIDIHGLGWVNLEALFQMWLRRNFNWRIVYYKIDAWLQRYCTVNQIIPTSWLRLRASFAIL
jgi:hypothetical protein